MIEQISSRNMLIVDMKRILLATDFSENSKWAMAYALNRNVSAVAEKEMQDLCAKGLGIYKNYESLLFTGLRSSKSSARRKIKKPDLIVVGTHGRSGLNHVLFGSTAEKVVRQAPCPAFGVRLPSKIFKMP